ncbi:MAG: sensor histidine kinase [Spirochaetota bacterium]
MSEHDYQQLLQFLYRVPVGLVEVDAEGNIQLMNAYAGAALMPLAKTSQSQNLFDLLRPYAPDLQRYVAGYDHPYGEIVSNERVQLPGAAGASETKMWYSVTIERLSVDSYMVALSDVSAEVEREERLQEAVNQEAEQRGRREIAASVLHDIGNALAGLSTHVARLLGEPGWRELTELRRLQELVENEAEALSRALGAKRQEALSTFLQELIANFEKRYDELKKTTNDMARTLEHVSETLSLQRQYAQEWVSGSRAPVNLVRLVEDAIAMQRSGFEKRSVRLTRNFCEGTVLVEGDRTKLVRVFVNLLKNALEAFDTPEGDNEEQRWVDIAVERVEGADTPLASVTIRDNGCGFDVPPESLSVSPSGSEQNTEKPGGSGMGLHAAKRIVEAHRGWLSLSSEGCGRGVTAVITLPRAEEIS